MLFEIYKQYKSGINTDKMQEINEFAVKHKFHFTYDIDDIDNIEYHKSNEIKQEIMMTPEYKKYNELVKQFICEQNTIRCEDGRVYFWVPEFDKMKADLCIKKLIE